MSLARLATDKHSILGGGDVAAHCGLADLRLLQPDRVKYRAMFGHHQLLAFGFVQESKRARQFDTEGNLLTQSFRTEANSGFLVARAIARCSNKADSRLNFAPLSSQGVA